MKSFSLSTLLVISVFCQGQTYTVSQIPYNPLPFDSGIQVVTPIDDTWGDVVGFGFDFYFFGKPQQSVIVSTNSTIGFNLANQNAFSTWQIPSPIPSANPEDFKNSIMFPWQDIDVTYGGTIRHQVYGSPPNRKFVVSFDSVPYYGSDSSVIPGFCPGNSRYTGQVILYEGSNNIEMHIHRKDSCNQWNNGLAVMGVQNDSGTIAYTVPGRNATIWTAYDEAWLFSPDSGSLPPNNLNRISGRVFADMNENCLFDSADYPLRNKPVLFNSTDYLFTDMLGYYSKQVDTGTFLISTSNIANQFYSPSCPPNGTYSIVFTNYNDSSDNNIFADTIAQFCAAIVPGLWPSGEDSRWSALGTCDTGYISITCTNMGVVSDTLGLFLSLNDSTVILNSPVPFSTVGTNQYYFPVGMMNPGDDTSIVLMVRYGCDSLGTIYCFEVEAVSGFQAPCPQYVSTQTNCRFIGVPFDPNAMYVSSMLHSERTEVEYLETEVNDHLSYLVAFQNTGTAVAHHVKLKIGLSPLVDAYSIAPLIASDPFSWLVLNDTLIVDFAGIELPDSNANEAESHGYFQFRVKPLATIVPGDFIHHNTNIYFDHNPPISTDTATVEIVEEDTVIIIGVKEMEELEVMLYPNPSGSRLDILYAGEESLLKVKDVTGRDIMERKLSEGKTSIDVSQWIKGVYFMVLQTAKKTRTLKFVKD